MPFVASLNSRGVFSILMVQLSSQWLFIMWVANGSGEFVENLPMMHCHGRIGRIASLVVSFTSSPMIVFSWLSKVSAVFMASGPFMVLMAFIAFTGVLGELLLFLVWLEFLCGGPISPPHLSFSPSSFSPHFSPPPHL